MSWSSGRGFTLIETLAMVVIMTLAASILAVSVSGISDASKRNEARAICQDFDRRARILARLQGEVHVLAAEDGTKLVMSEDDLGQVVIASEQLPRGLTFEIERELSEGPSLAIDSSGASQDYQGYLRNADVIVDQWSVQGLTGQITPTGSAQAPDPGVWRTAASTATPGGVP